MPDKQSYADFLAQVRAMAPKSQLSDEELGNEYWNYLSQVPGAQGKVLEHFTLPGGATTNFLKGVVRGVVPFADKIPGVGSMISPTAGEFNEKGTADAGDYGEVAGDLASFVGPSLVLKALKIPEYAALGAKALDVGARTLHGGLRGIEQYQKSTPEAQRTYLGDAANALSGALSEGLGAYVPASASRFVRTAVPLGIQIGSNAIKDAEKGYENGGVVGAINSGVQAFDPRSNPWGTALGLGFSTLGALNPKGHGLSIVEDTLRPGAPAAPGSLAAKYAAAKARSSGAKLDDAAMQGFARGPEMSTTTEALRDAVSGGDSQVAAAAKAVTSPDDADLLAGLMDFPEAGPRGPLSPERRAAEIQQMIAKLREKPAVRQFGPDELYMIDEPNGVRGRVLDTGKGGWQIEDSSGARSFTWPSDTTKFARNRGTPESRDLVMLPQGAKPSRAFADKLRGADIKVVGETDNGFVIDRGQGPLEIVPKSDLSQPDVLPMRQAKLAAKKKMDELKGATTVANQGAPRPLILTPASDILAAVKKQLGLLPEDLGF